MSALTVVLALSAALSNAAASVLQRRAAAQDADDVPPGHPVRWMLRLVRDPYWVGGAALLAVTTVLQAAALAVGSLALVQPLMASELLFTLVVGSVVFRHRPDATTWLAFGALAVGLALFLGAASPAGGQDTATPGRWAAAGPAVLCAVVVLAATGRLTRGAPRAALLGSASAVAFAGTAALLKEVTGRFPQGVGAVLTQWPLYATGVVGAVSFLLLQGALRAGTLAASQPALTLGDALTSVALGWALFGEQIALGVRILPEVIGVALIGLGSLGLARAPSVHGAWDTVAATREPAGGGSGSEPLEGGSAGGPAGGRARAGRLPGGDASGEPGCYSSGDSSGGAGSGQDSGPGSGDTGSAPGGGSGAARCGNGARRGPDGGPEQDAVPRPRPRPRSGPGPGPEPGPGRTPTDE